MNYYEHHIRDYDAATAHLSWDEDLAYTRLIRWYYRKEQPIPADIKEACRQVRATSKTQRDAVESVLREFFELRDDGWHQNTCDEVIGAFQAGEPEREVKKANEENRLKKHRLERAALFKRLTDAGQHATWNIRIDELRELVAKLPATEPETASPPLPATAPATPATATQTPDTNTHTPVLKTESTAHASTNSNRPSSGGLASARMRQAGLADANPSHPKLLALLAEGITLDELGQAAGEAVQKKKGFAYALAVAEGRRRDAATAPLPAKSESRQAQLEARNAAVAAAWVPPEMRSKEAV